jgi:histidyl-tRNA synthetase
LLLLQTKIMKPALPKGTRDFSPIETARRRYIFETIRTEFELFGYQSIETPAMENLSTLTGKYGEEGDRLIFKILNSGDYLKEVREKQADLEKPNSVLPLLSEKALRYDLTVPFARYVAMNRDKIAFPFKRYQMQPVWRADRPQKGRYREFWQCDADVVGSASLLNEAELIQIYDRVFHQLSLPVRILVNNRKILAGMAEIAGISAQLTDFTVALDKIDKVGIEQVEAELREKGISENAISKLRPIALLQGNNTEKLASLQTALKGSEMGLKGVAEMQELLNYFETNLALMQAEITIDLSLARGLNYYTGTILEVKARDVAFGSIGGGGRYDDLTGIFGLPGVPGVGISFGADRIYDVLNELNLFPKEAINTSEVLIAHFSAEELAPCLALVQDLREEGIAAEVYPEAGKLKKQFEYAEKKGIPFLMIYGATEEAASIVNVKELSSGRQVIVPRNEIATFRSYFNL